MEFNEFVEVVKSEVEKRVGEGNKVMANNVIKNNGLSLTGLSIIEGESNISPTIYLDSLYDSYNNGSMTIIGVIDSVMEAYERNKVNKNVDMKYFLDFEQVKDGIVYKLVNTEKNRELLEDCPHVEYLDLSIVFSYLVASEEEQIASILIHNSHMKLWNVTVDELYRLAEENTSRLLGTEIKTMSDIVREIVEEEYIDAEELEHQVPMLIITNRQRVDGASCIIYHDFLKGLGEKLMTDFYIIPSSVNECILVPTQGTEDADGIKQAIKEINDTQVKLEEILSYSLYFFDRSTNELQICA
jgi:hypothetical protein